MLHVCRGPGSNIRTRAQVREIPGFEGLWSRALDVAKVRPVGKIGRADRVAGRVAMSWQAWVVAAVGVVGWGGCGPARSAHDFQEANPLGTSFWLVPVPSEGTELLGRAFVRPPDATFSLEEQSQPNPCDAQLSAATPADMNNRYESAIDLRSFGGASAMLGLYGFSGQAASASHLLYKVSTARKLTRLDTNGYVSCCQSIDCGWGYVSALIYGEGEYVSASEAAASGSASYQVVSAQGQSSYQALDRKQIRGWLAAVITPHDRRRAAHACPGGEVWAGYECVDRDFVGHVRHSCAHNGADDPFWKDSPNMQHNLKEQQSMACRWLAEHDLGP